MDQLFRRLQRLIDGLIGNSGQETPEADAMKPPLSRREVPHECGHVAVAWMLPAVLQIEGIAFHQDGGARTRITFDRNHPDYRLDDLVCTLGGLAGEMLAYGRAHTDGLGGSETNDLSLALGLAEAVLEETDPLRIEARWRNRLAATSLDVAAMFMRRPPEGVAAVLNLAYRRAKRLLIENRPGFERLRRLAASRRDLGQQEIESQFGPRPWGRRN